MKKILLSGLIFALLFGSCKKETIIVKKVPVVVEPVSEECYMGIFNRDTIEMHLRLKGKLVTGGTLKYRLFQKDRNDGALAGQIKGDTLFAIYTFQSEGQTSTREVAFLKKGTTYREGYGETTVDPAGNPIFKNQRQLKFDGKLILNAADCN